MNDDGCQALAAADIETIERSIIDDEDTGLVEIYLVVFSSFLNLLLLVLSCMKSEQKLSTYLYSILSIVNLIGTISNTIQGIIKDYYDATPRSAIECKLWTFTTAFTTLLSLLVICIITVNVQGNIFGHLTTKVTYNGQLAIALFFLTLIIGGTIPVFIIHEIRTSRNIVSVSIEDEVNFCERDIETVIDLSNVTNIEQSTNVTISYSFQNTKNTYKCFYCCYASQKYTWKIYYVCVVYFITMTCIVAYGYLLLKRGLELLKVTTPRRTIENISMQLIDQSSSGDHTNTSIQENEDLCPYNIPIRATLQQRQLEDSKRTKLLLRILIFVIGCVTIIIMLGIHIPFLLITLFPLYPHSMYSGALPFLTLPFIGNTCIALLNIKNLSLLEGGNVIVI